MAYSSSVWSFMHAKFVRWLMPVHCVSVSNVSWGLPIAMTVTANFEFAAVEMEV